MPESAPKKVLIVEDEAEVADMFGLMLEMNGYQVVKVHGTGRAMQVISQEKPDAVLLDVMMPDISGLELCRYVRREPSTENLPIVICSARVQPEDVQEGLDAGASLYLTKPVSLAELAKALKEVLPP